MQGSAFSALVLAVATLVACNRSQETTSSSPATTASATTTAAAATNTAAAATGEIAVGSVPPDFTAKAHDGKEIRPSALKGSPIVLYFYPRDETPGCTKEACSFRDAWKDIEKTGAVLVGISSDSDESHRAFASHHKLPFHLVADTDGSIAKLYGVPNRAGFFARHTVVIGRDGKISHIYRSVDVSKHAAEILADVQGT